MKKKIRDMEAREKEVELKRLEDAKPKKFTDKVRQFESNKNNKRIEDEDEDD